MKIAVLHTLWTWTSTMIALIQTEASNRSRARVRHPQVQRTAQEAWQVTIPSRRTATRPEGRSWLHIGRAREVRSGVNPPILRSSPPQHLALHTVCSWSDTDRLDTGHGI